jgi:pimeloyl-ACP methyl ester carboxylesterase
MTDTASKNRAASASPSLWKWGAGAAALGAAGIGAALFNRERAKRAERDNPPLGEFLTVDGVRLHYLQKGEGEPIVFLHGNGTMIEDWLISGVMDELAQTNQVIAFDRPGFGHTERPRSRIWTPSAQAALLAEAFEELGIEAPLVVGHSFGTLVAMALALDHPGKVSGLALLGGYFFPSFRLDALFGSQPAIPGVGDAMRYTVSPLIGAALAPKANDKIFEPAPVTAQWERDFPLNMALRPSQIRAEAAEAALMAPAAAQLSPRYGALTLPTAIVAGSGDAIVTTADQSQRLHETLPQSSLLVVEGAGHMVHHTATREVVRAIRGS